MFKSKRMRSFLGVVVVLMVGVTVWLTVAKPAVVSNQGDTNVSKTGATDTKKTPVKSSDKPAEKQTQAESLDMPSELSTTGGINIVTPIAFAGVAFSTTGYIRSKRLARK
ncbi:hypothetical protein FWF48_01130 [Candidatus Saccharibacteria bacterium]|nr:hypothetical protein [Candidatus Saccharibacteria bacterium]